MEDEKWHEILATDNIKEAECILTINNNTRDLFSCVLNDKMSDIMANYLFSHIDMDILSSKFTEEHLKILLEKGYFITSANVLSGVYFDWDYYDDFLVKKYVIMYGNAELVHYIFANEDTEVSTNYMADMPHTWAWYLLKPNINVYDNSVERYEAIFSEIVDNVDERLGNDLMSRFDTMVVRFPNILEFLVANYSITAQFALNAYIISILEDNVQITRILDPLYKLYKNIENPNNPLDFTSDQIIQTLCGHPCKNIECLKRLLDTFTIPSYTYFCISIAKEPLLLSTENPGNKETFLQLVPNMYSEHVIVTNILTFYRLHIDLDMSYPEILSDCLLYNPNINLCENDTLFLGLRNMLVSHYNVDDECDILPYSSNLLFLAETYPNNYTVEQGDNISEYYYLLKSETPYNSSDYEINKEIFLDLFRIPAVSPETCLICMETISTNTIKCCDSTNFKGHLYCEECIEKWLRDGNRTCPTCRRKLF
jgi:hypothetical protein